MADESADSGRREQLSVCVRFVFKEADTFVVREEFVGFITCKSTTEMLNGKFHRNVKQIMEKVACN